MVPSPFPSTLPPHPLLFIPSSTPSFVAVLLAIVAFVAVSIVGFVGVVTVGTALVVA